MIDVHMLTLPTDKPEWKAQAIAALPPWVTLHIVDAQYGPIGPQRLAAFRMGTNPFVSCIDPDDWTEPDTFDKCRDALLDNPSWPGVVTKELTHDLRRNRTYVTTFKHKTFVLRREWMEEREALWRFDMDDKDIIGTPSIRQLSFIGHHWRVYNSEGRKQRRLKQI